MITFVDGDTYIRVIPCQLQAGDTLIGANAYPRGDINCDPTVLYFPYTECGAEVRVDFSNFALLARGTWLLMLYSVPDNLTPPEDGTLQYTTTAQVYPARCGD